MEVSAAGGPVKLVSKKLAGVLTPVTEADTVKGLPLAFVFAVIIPEVATPEASVTAVLPPAKTTEGTLWPGAVKVTVTPLIRLLNESVTTALSGSPYVEPASVDWPLPEDTAMVAGLPAVLVIAKVTVKAPAVAVTL